MKKITLLILILISTIMLVHSKNNVIFATWIEWSCKPFDKGMLTALPHFKICQHKLKNVSNMLNYEDLPEVNSERWLSFEDLEGEIWKDVRNYETKYQISNYGRVKSKERARWNGRCFVKQKGRIMRLSLLKTKGGYYYVSFHNKSGETSNKIFTHRLVAESFIPNENNYPCVNHKNENSRDNRVCNLEWCDYAYNNSYGTGQTRSQITRIEKRVSKPVGVYNAEGNLLERYISIGQAAKPLGIHKATLSGYIHSGKKYKNGLYYRFIEWNL
jgi:hypothetical protein